MTAATTSAGPAPGLPALTRRSLLRASPALLASGALASYATEVLPAPAETPVMALYRQLQALFARCEEPGLPEDEFQAAFDLMHEVEQRMTEAPATTLADLAAKVLILTQIRDTTGTIHEPALRDQMEALVAGEA